MEKVFLVQNIRLGFVYFVVSLFPIFLKTAVGEEYCLTRDTFHAQCNDTQVILMRKARYGRMYTGRCISSDDAASIGCYGDVLSYLDRLCSGSRQCSVQVEYFEDIVVGCYKGDRLRFLDASYECIDVDNDDCLEESRNDTSGYIQGVWRADNAHQLLPPLAGTAACPWKLSSSPGQQIQVELLDITLSDILQSNEDYQRDVCPLSIVLTENEKITQSLSSDSTGTKLPLCNDRNTRRSLLFLSSASYVEFYLESQGQSPLTQPFFLFYYQAIGCADIPLPNNMWSQREGEALIVRCNHTDETWFLICQENEWQGLLGNCSSTTTTAIPSEQPETQSSIPLGVVIAISIGVGIGIVVGLTLLGIVIGFIRCCSKKPVRAPDLSRIQVPYPTTSKQGQYDDLKTIENTPGTSQRDANYSHYGAVRNQQLPLPPPPPAGHHSDHQKSVYHVYSYYDKHKQGANSQFSEPQRTRASHPIQEHDDEHIYETAYFTRPLPQLTQGMSDVKQTESRQKSLAKEYYEMRGTPQNTLENSDKQHLKY